MLLTLFMRPLSAGLLCGPLIEGWGSVLGGEILASEVQDDAPASTWLGSCPDPTITITQL